MSTKFSKGKKSITLFNTEITFSYKKQQSKNSKSIQKIKEETAEKFKPEFNNSLHKNLKHLEFINFLEMNYNEKQLTKLPSDFVQVIEQCKKQTQNNVISLFDRKVA